MNKSELVEKIAATKEASAMKKSHIEQILNETFNLIKTTVKKDDVTLIGFGTFSKSKRKARLGRNPQTGEEIKIPARTVPRFKPGKEFKEMLR